MIFFILETEKENGIDKHCNSDDPCYMLEAGLIECDSVLFNFFAQD